MTLEGRLQCINIIITSAQYSNPALPTCETSQVLLAGVSGGFPGVLLFRPTYRLDRLNMSEIILKMTYVKIK